MRRGSSWLGAVIIVATAFALGPRARAALGPGIKDARSITWEAAGAFRVGRYGEAAAKYEAAFALRPDPALLYNAAQSHRLAGNKPRALELYRDYVRLYPDGASAEDARGHVSALKKVVEDQPHPQPASATAPPVAAPAPPDQGTLPASVETPAPATPPPTAATPPSPRTNPSVPLLSRPAPAPAEARGSLTQQTWFWIAVGAAVVVVGTTVILLASRGETFPEPTFGTARGN
jgi:tetratricopeptide (TPR) repeat protein